MDGRSMPMLRFALRRARVAAVVLLTCGLAVSTARAGSPAEDADFLDALTWGVSASSYEELRALGRERWLKAQLSPPPEERLPPETRARVAALQPEGTLLERLQAAKNDKVGLRSMDADARDRERQALKGRTRAVATDAAAATILRALAGRDPLRERLTWFWFNHFNVFKGRMPVSVSVGDYVDSALRPRALGRFRDLLLATVKHPAMLAYLNNLNNRAGRRNENYARELMELHTMGAGSGYTQADVESLSRILTGVGIAYEGPGGRRPLRPGAVQEGAFAFRPGQHDFGDKVLLGRTIRGSGWPEVLEAVEIVSRHPATARHVSRALAQYFMGGVEPSEALVGQLAEVFTRSDGRIAEVLDALVRAPEFEASLGRQFKDPMRFVLSALRLAYDGREIRNAAPVQQWLKRVGQDLFTRTTPDGYPLEPSAWSGPGQLLARFEVAQQIGSGEPKLFAPATDRTADAAPEAGGSGGASAVPSLRNAFYETVLAPSLSASTREALAKAESPGDWNTLFLSSPEFMK